jgi:hypothetical protein
MGPVRSGVPGTRGARAGLLGALTIALLLALPAGALAATHAHTQAKYTNGKGTCNFPDNQQPLDFTYNNGVLQVQGGMNGAGPMHSDGTFAITNPTQRLIGQITGTMLKAEFTLQLQNCTETWDVTGTLDNVLLAAATPTPFIATVPPVTPAPATAAPTAVPPTPASSQGPQIPVAQTSPIPGWTLPVIGGFVIAVLVILIIRRPKKPIVGVLPPTPDDCSKLRERCRDLTAKAQVARQHAEEARQEYEKAKQDQADWQAQVDSVQQQYDEAVAKLRAAEAALAAFDQSRSDPESQIKLDDIKRGLANAIKGEDELRTMLDDRIKLRDQARTAARIAEDNWSNLDAYASKLEAEAAAACIEADRCEKDAKSGAPPQTKEKEAPKDPKTPPDPGAGGSDGGGKAPPNIGVLPPTHDTTTERPPDCDDNEPPRVDNGPPTEVDLYLIAQAQLRIDGKYPPGSLEAAEAALEFLKQAKLGGQIATGLKKAVTNPVGSIVDSAKAGYNLWKKKPGTPDDIDKAIDETQKLIDSLRQQQQWGDWDLVAPLQRFRFSCRTTTECRNGHWTSTREFVWDKVGDPELRSTGMSPLPNVGSPDEARAALTKLSNVFVVRNHAANDAVERAAKACGG